MTHPSDAGPYREGHRNGGLLLFMGLLSVGCGGPAPAARAEPVATAASLRPLDSYRQLGFLTGPVTFPVVGRWSTMAGAADSTLFLLGLSLPASALRFQRDGDGFAAEYLVALRFARGDEVVGLVDRRETVRVPGFAETTRTEEAVIFQAAVHLVPGRYTMTLRARDALGARGMDITDTVVVPSYRRPGAPLPPPLVVHEATRRSAASIEPDLILNPRHTVPYGDAPPRAYVEAYGGGSDLRILLEDERGGVVWSRPLELEGDEALASAVVVLPTDTLPLGRFRLVVSRGDDRTPGVPLIVALSDRWLVSNFEEVLDVLRPIATIDELNALAEPATRRERWEAFWAARDPVPASPENEFRQAYFERIRVASEQFAEPTRPGWRTDRGEVYIVLGPPSRIVEPGDRGRRASAGPRRLEWLYDHGVHAGLSLSFVDRSGTGVWALTTGSRSAFRSAARRLRPDRP